MKSFDSPAGRAARWLSHCALLALAAALLLSAQALGSQQPAAGRKKVPKLTTDDVTPPSAEQAAEAQPADASSKPDAPGSQDDKVSTEESSWRERLAAARERAKETERAAEEAELRITELRNELGVSGQTAQHRNDTAQGLEEAGRRLIELRAQARAAAEELKQLLEYGRQKRFTEDEGPKPTSEDGKANNQYYRAKFAALYEALQTAERRIQLYENRVRDLNQRIQINSGSGDNFFIMQIQQERDETQQKLDEARAAREKAQSDIEDLKEQARRAGVLPGVFR
jgi:chromosome segregation ATPase